MASLLQLVGIKLLRWEIVKVVVVDWRQLLSSLKKRLRQQTHDFFIPLSRHEGVRETYWLQKSLSKDFSAWAGHRLIGRAGHVWGEHYNNV